MDIRYTGVVVVIPTRNRAGLAINAVNSVLNQAEKNIHVLVSDNSTIAENAYELFNFWQKIRDTRVRYITPPKPMTMSDHWEWAIQQALLMYDVSHFTYLSDRAVFISGGFKKILHHSKTFPDKVISYNFDEVDDTQNPVLLLQNDWTGRLYEVESSHLLNLASQVKVKACLPKMLNGIAPRTIIQNINKRFGSIFGSISPDYCFAFRCLEIVDSIAYLDKAAILGYAQNWSNGWSFTTGIINEARTDFIANLGGNPVLFATPIPELLISTNAIIHEYCTVKEQTKSLKFPEINKRQYLEAMVHMVESIRNPEVKREMMKLLESHRWENSQRTLNHKDIDDVPSSLKVKSLMQKIGQLLRNPHVRPLWLLLSRLFGIYPSGIRFEFKTTEEAIEYANRFPRRKRFKIDYLMQILETTNLKTL